MVYVSNYSENIVQNLKSFVLLLKKNKKNVKDFKLELVSTCFKLSTKKMSEENSQTVYVGAVCSLCTMPHVNQTIVFPLERMSYSKSNLVNSQRI